LKESILLFNGPKGQCAWYVIDLFLPFAVTSPMARVFSEGAGGCGTVGRFVLVRLVS